MAKKQKGGRAVRKKKVVVESNGQAHIKATFNNVMVTLTDQYGNTISWASSGKMGFKGSRKNTPYAAQVASSAAAKEAYDLGQRAIYHATHRDAYSGGVVNSKYRVPLFLIMLLLASPWNPRSLEFHFRSFRSGNILKFCENLWNF